MSKVKSDLELRCDFEPNKSEEEIRGCLKELFKNKAKQNLLNTISALYTKRFCESLLKHLQIDGSKKSAEVGKVDINKLVQHIKSSSFQIDGVYGFKKAEVTAGGIDLQEIDSRTMQSKICTGLYFAGEVIDLDGPIGGYNFQAAFSTGWLAGMQI